MGTGKLEMCISLSLSHSHSLVHQETDENGNILTVLYLISPLVANPNALVATTGNIKARTLNGSHMM